LCAFIKTFYFPLQVKELKEKMLSSGMPWPGDESEQRWEQAWMAIKKV
jgi:alpha-glucan,water dikinase